MKCPNFLRCGQCSEGVEHGPTQEGRVIAPRRRGKVQRLQLGEDGNIHRILTAGELPTLDHVGERNGHPDNFNKSLEMNSDGGLAGTDCLDPPFRSDGGDVLVVGEKLGKPGHISDASIRPVGACQQLLGFAGSENPAQHCPVCGQSAQLRRSRWFGDSGEDLQLAGVGFLLCWLGARCSGSDPLRQGAVIAGAFGKTYFAFMWNTSQWLGDEQGFFREGRVDPAATDIIRNPAVVEFWGVTPQR